MLAETIMSADGKQMLLKTGQVLNQTMIRKPEEREIQLNDPPKMVHHATKLIDFLPGKVAEGF